MSAGMSAPSLRKKSFARSNKSTVKMCIREQREFLSMSSVEMFWPVPMRAIGAQNLLTMPGGVTNAGYLHKKGGSQFSLKKWPLRYIIIHKGCVYYFKSSTSPEPQGAFSLNGYNRVMRAAEETTSSNVFPFKLVHFSKKHRTWFFSAASEDERRKWMRYLRKEIDHYNGRKEPHPASDSDSDAESFYGTIERPMDIKHPIESLDDDYVEEDDDDEEPDYLRPDSECSPTSSGRPTGPPPSYPPPPVPASYQPRRDSSPNFPKYLPPPMSPQHRNPTSPLPSKPPPCVPPPHIDMNKSLVPSPSFIPPKPSFTTPLPPPPPSSKKTIQNRTFEQNDWGPQFSVTLQTPATLPICEKLESRLALNGPDHHSLGTGSTQSFGRNWSKAGVPPPQSKNSEGQSLSPNHSPLPDKPPSSPHLKSGLHGRPGMPKGPPTKPKPGTSLQRASPEGQSFRSQGNEVPKLSRVKQNSAVLQDDSDDDYENVQLPDSVFIDSTETSFVEKLFRESLGHPRDGLYGIRNSGTKTTKVLVVWDVSINKARNYRLFEEEDCIFLESDVTFSKLSHLIEHYYSHPLPHHGSLCLQIPYTKTPNS